MKPMRRGMVNKGATGPASMHLPQHVYNMFEARPPVEFIPPRKDEEEARQRDFDGVSKYLEKFEDFDRINTVEKPKKVVVTSQEVKDRRKRKIKKRKKAMKKKKKEQKLLELEEKAKSYDPKANLENKTKNEYNTLFVGRLRKSTTEKKLHSTFSKFGTVKQIVVVKKCSCAFVEFSNEDELMDALKSGTRYIDRKRVVLDVERARTVEGWKPKLFGGGVSSSSTPSYVNNPDSSYNNNNSSSGNSRYKY